MKKAFVVVILLLSLVAGGCSVSTYYKMDADPGEIKERMGLIKKTIEMHQCAIDELEWGEVTSGNPRKIAEYHRGEIVKLQKQLDEYVLRAAGKDVIEGIVLKGTNPREVAEALALIKWVDNPKLVSTDQGGNQFKGILINRRGEAVIAQVSGGGIRMEFQIPPGGQSEPFNLPMPGNYTATFISTRHSYSRASVVKMVGLGNRYFDDKGNEFDFVATATPY